MANITIVVDVLNGFCKAGNLASPRCDAAIPRIRDLIDERRRAGDQLIFLADTHDPNDREFEVFPVHCVRGTKEADVVEELQPFLKDATLIRKRRYSGFFETNLDELLKAARPEQVTVIGVCTDICVLHTVADLRNRDYRVWCRRRPSRLSMRPGIPATRYRSGRSRTSRACSAPESFRHRTPPASGRVGARRPTRAAL